MGGGEDRRTLFGGSSCMAWFVMWVCMRAPMGAALELLGVMVLRMFV